MILTFNVGVLPTDMQMNQLVVGFGYPSNAGAPVITAVGSPFMVTIHPRIIPRIQ